MMKTILVSLIVLAFVSSLWAYSKVGCFVDVTQSILQGIFTESTNMTIEKCVQICSLEGDYFAGLENGSQCLCGNHLKPNVQLAETECSTACEGDISQKCGGTLKASVYTTNANYLGCYKDEKDRILEGELITNASMTTMMCIETCQQDGKRFALTEYSSQCFCGNHLKNYTKKAESDCRYPCAGNANEMCGGHYHGSLYLINYNEM